MINKKRLIISSVISIVLVSILLIGSTYSIFTTQEIDEELNVYKTGNLNVTYTLSESNVQITDNTPMTEEEADGVTPYRITVTNSGNVPYMFDVILSDTTSSSDNTIDSQYIMTKVGYLTSKKLSNCTNNIIKEDIILPAGESVDIDVRVWLSDNISNSEIGKSFYAKLSIDGLAVYNDNTDIDNSILSLKYMKKLFTSSSDTTYFKSDTYREKIKTASFIDYIDTTNAVSTDTIWDVSEKGDNSIVAWLEPNTTDGYYDLYIGSSNKIYPKTLDLFFYNLRGLETINFSNLKTSLVTDMSAIFAFCENLILLDVSNFDTSNVTNMYWMFAGCNSLIELDVSKFNTANVTNMYGMFSACNSLTELDLSNFDTSNVTDMNAMFNNCIGLTELDLSNFDTSNAINIGSMFSGSSSLTELDLSNFDTSKVTNMAYMFYDCSGLTELDLSSFDTSNVTNMANMFAGCSELESLDLSNFDTSNVTKMDSMFKECNSLTNLNVSSFNTGNVKNMAYMFEKCSSLTSLYLSNFNTSNVTDMSGMFGNCSNLTTLDLSNFDTSNVTNMNGKSGWFDNNYYLGMFEGCTKLTTTITIRNSTTTYENIFKDAATAEGALITVNYTAVTSNLVTNMTTNKDSNIVNGNIVKGTLVA